MRGLHSSLFYVLRISHFLWSDHFVDATAACTDDRGNVGGPASAGHSSSGHLSHDEEGQPIGDNPTERYAANYIARLAAALSSSLTALGATDVTDAKLESWSMLIYESMSNPARNFHGVQHAFDVAGGTDDPVQILSILFHDVVYFAVDGGLSPRQADALAGVVRLQPVKEEEGDGGREGYMMTLTLDANSDPPPAMVASLFGLRPGQVMSVDGGRPGTNEFLSAIVAVRALENTLNPSRLAQIAACIEATIPFRRPEHEDGILPRERLYLRLSSANDDFHLGMTEAELVEAVQRAVGVANLDVANFASDDPAFFLQQGWKLLPEMNPPLRNPNLFTVSDYQFALKGMEGFMTNINAGVVFHAFRGVPDEDTLARMTRRAARNIDVARSVLRSMFLGVSVLVALAELTGGDDAPMALFMEDPPTTHLMDVSIGNSMIEATLSRGAELDVDVYRILSKGQSAQVNSDIEDRPLSAYLYILLGGEGVKSRLQYATHPRKLLASMPRQALVAIVETVATVATTRHQILRQVLDQIAPLSDIEL